MKLSLPLLLIFSLFLLVCSGVVSAGDGCTNFVLNLSTGLDLNLNESCQLPTLDYNFNATIKILKDNITLDCSTSNLIGSPNRNTTGIKINGVNNITIKNCYFSKFNNSIWINSSINSTVINNYFNNSPNFQSDNAHVRLTGLGYNNQIINNTMITSLYGIYNYDSMNFTKVINNTILSTGSISIYLLQPSGNHLIDNNVINNSGWNVASLSSYSNYTNNYAYNCTHHALDIRNSDWLVEGCYVADNYWDWDLGNTAGGGISLLNATNNTFLNNQLYNIPSTFGIGVDFHAPIYYNYFFNNTLSMQTDTSAYCISDDAITDTELWSTKYINNTLLNCNGNDVKVTGKQTYFEGNNYQSNPVKFNSTNTYSNTTVNETMDNFIQYSTQNKGVVNFNWAGNKFFKLKAGNTILITASDSNHNISCNYNNGTVINNFQTQTFTVASNQNIVCQYSSASGGCDYPFDNYTASISSTLCPGTYILNDIEGDGIVKFVFHSNLFLLPLVNLFIPCT